MPGLHAFDFRFGCGPRETFDVADRAHGIVPPVRGEQRHAGLRGASREREHAALAQPAVMLQVVRLNPVFVDQTADGLV